MRENTEIIPLTTRNWPDLETLFGEHGASGGCWCMWFRLTNAEFECQRGEGNQKALKKIVDDGIVPGLIACVDGVPAGWVSVAPRAELTRLARSRVTKAVDEQSAWSVVCFYVAKPYRKQDLSTTLLKAAVDYARQQGANIVEGYPVDTAEGAVSDAGAYHGTMSAFEKVGFTEVARRSKGRPVMRYWINS